MTLGTARSSRFSTVEFEAAEELIGESLTLGQRTWIVSLLNARMELWLLRRHQGRLPEVEEAIEQCLAEFPERGALCQSVLAHINAELGDLGEARRLFDQLAADQVANVPPTSDRLVNLGLLLDVAAMLKDAEHGEVVYELLLPAAACNAVDLPDICTGSVARNLGLLAAVMGRWAEAERHSRLPWR